VADLTPTPSEVVLRPDAQVWREALSRTPDDAAREFRREVGLPATGPIVMSGHQPTFWHPGIFAKWIAMVRAAEVCGAQAAWVVVDHDAVAPTRVRLPVTLPDGSLAAREYELSSREYLAAVPAGARAASAVTTPTPREGERFALESVREGLTSMVAACSAFTKAASAAEQVAHASAKIIHEDVLKSHRPPTIVLATSLNRSLAFRRLVAQMVQDPEACARSYNDAVAAQPHARLRPMAISKADCEMPLWWLRDGTRQDVRASDLTVMLASGLEAAWETLAPKALFMTLLLRLHGCELFIHGLGGGGTSEGEGYDDAMQEWARRWVGGVTLAPMATVSATLRLAFDGSEHRPLVSTAESRRAQWAAAHARHDPAMLGDAAAASIKKNALAHIASLPRHDPRRRSAFLDMHSALERMRHDRQSQLDQLTADSAALHAQAVRDEVRLERTWPFPVYPPSALDALAREISARLTPSMEPTS
jgi:hypothetical protein